MSSQRGNVSKTRTQKHQNKTVFKNNMHDKSPGVKLINSLTITNVCDRCKGILEWKIKYKKYKPLKAPGKCVKCSERNVKHAYHIMCSGCSSKLKVCPKCDTSCEIDTTVTESLTLESREIQSKIQSLTERKRRKFHRFTQKLSISSTTPLTPDVTELLDKLCIQDAKSSDLDDDDFDEDDFDF